MCDTKRFCTKRFLKEKIIHHKNVFAQKLLLLKTFDVEMIFEVENVLFANTFTLIQSLSFNHYFLSIIKKCLMLLNQIFI